MEKFLKVTLSSQDYLININHILTVEAGAGAGQVDILYDIVAHTADGAGDTIGVQLTASTADDAAKVKEQINSIVEAIENALSTSWNRPSFVLEPKYPVTGIAQVQIQWA
tara:strand:- start:217 stop:546 length:330 start_codon:yes stop_codon:yes gene_type:complete